MTTTAEEQAKMQHLAIELEESSKGDANLFEGYCARMRAAKDPLVIREEQRLAATDTRLSIDQSTAIQDLAVELLARKKA